MTITAMREAIATNLATISGLRTSAYVPDNPTPPIAVVVPSRTDYDMTFQRGMDSFNFQIILIGHRVSERNAQSTLDSYLNSSGATSIKQAVESSNTLGGSAFDIRVTEMSNYGPLAIGETQYLSATFSVSVIAN